MLDIQTGGPDFNPQNHGRVCCYVLVFPAYISSTSETEAGMGRGGEGHPWGSPARLLNLLADHYVDEDLVPKTQSIRS